MGRFPIKIDQNVDVAVLTIIAAGDRSEDGGMPHA